MHGGLVVWENVMDGKLILATGANWLFFVVALVLIGMGLYLIFLAAQSMLKARQEHRLPVAAFAISVLAGVVFSIPVYPVLIIQQTNIMLEDAEPEIFKFVDSMNRIMQRGFAVADNAPEVTITTIPTTSPEPETAPSPTPTVTPYPILTIDPLITPINSEAPTPTVDVAAQATQNAARMATQNAPATLDPALWNPQTPPPTPAQ